MNAKCFYLFIYLFIFSYVRVVFCVRFGLEIGMYGHATGKARHPSLFFPLTCVTSPTVSQSVLAVRWSLDGVAEFFVECVYEWTNWGLTELTTECECVIASVFAIRPSLSWAGRPLSAVWPLWTLHKAARCRVREIENERTTNSQMCPFEVVHYPLEPRCSFFLDGMKGQPSTSFEVLSLIWDLSSSLWTVLSWRISAWWKNLMFVFQQPDQLKMWSVNNQVHWNVRLELLRVPDVA